MINIYENLNDLFLQLQTEIKEIYSTNNSISRYIYTNIKFN